MGNSLNLSETLIIALGALTAVFAILVLYAISIVSKLSQTLAGGNAANSGSSAPAQSSSNNAVAQAPVQSFDNTISEEDKLVVALAASALVAEQHPDSYFHIKKITRVR